VLNRAATEDRHPPSPGVAGAVASWGPNGGPNSRFSLCLACVWRVLGPVKGLLGVACAARGLFPGVLGSARCAWFWAPRAPARRRFAGRVAVARFWGEGA
jgi:hypothetical protein